jgi:hypothetical protein
MSSFETTYNAKVVQDHIVAYRVIWSDKHNGGDITIWNPNQTYKKNQRCYHLNELWVSQCDDNYRNEPGTNELKWAHQVIEHGFSAGAQKRFAQALDNFTAIFNAVYSVNKDLLKYENFGKWKFKKPVFCTLTVPQQNISDADVKKHCLDRWLDNLKKNHDVKMYVWRAEAQLRDAIHFHLVLDRFLDESKARKTWYNLLRENNCLNSGQLLHESSQIVRLNMVENIDTLKFELSGYFAAKESEDDPKRLKYKHNKEITVRKIEGNQWGYSDCLKYRAVTFSEIYADHEQYINHKPLLQKEILDSNDKSIGNLYVYRNVFPVGKVEPGKKRKRVMKKAPMHFQIMKLLNLYHYFHAIEIYGGSRLGSPEFYELFRENNFFKIPKYHNAQTFDDYLMAPAKFYLQKLIDKK